MSTPITQTNKIKNHGTYDMKTPFFVFFYYVLQHCFRITRVKENFENVSKISITQQDCGKDVITVEKRNEKLSKRLLQLHFFQTS